MVLITKDTCDTDTPKIAGAMFSNTRLTAASLKSNLGIFKKPSFANAGNWKPNCKIPPTNTAHAKAKAGGSKYGVKNSANTMNDTFKKVGVNAGIENWW